MASREVGRPDNNKGFIQPRDVSVAHDKPRINDQRKVRPHAAGQPAMGVRPSGGHQTEPKKPPLGKDRMEMRDVPVKVMTEAELAEFSLPSWLGGRKKPTGDKIAYQINPEGVNLYHIRPDGSMLSVNPRKIAINLAHAYARQAGIRPSQVGELGKDINFFKNRPNGAGPAAAQGGGQAPGAMPGGAPGGPSMPPSGPAPTGGPSGPGRFSVGAPPPSPMGNRAAFMQRRNNPTMAGPNAGPSDGPGGMPPAAKPGGMGGSAAPAPAPAAQSGGPAPIGFVGPDQINMMYQNAPEYFPPGSLDRLSQYQLGQVWNALISKKPTKGMTNNYQKYMAAKGGGGGPPMSMAAESRMYENRGHVGKTLQAIKGMGMHASYDRDSDEFRVNHPHNKEETAYYTNDHQDAVGTARHMKAQSMSEGYPDTSFERRPDVSHSSKIGSNLFPSHNVPETGKPDLNREFAQFRDLHIEKVTEHANSEMASFLDGFAGQLGYAPILEDDEEEKAEHHEAEGDDPPEDCMEGRLPRARHRWV